MSDLPSCSSNVSKKKQFTWNRETTTDLIIMYEAQPVLYVTTLKEYKNKNKRMDAIRTITNELLSKYPEICSNITSDEVQKKIHGSRTQYLRELGILKKFLSSGAPADAYIPKLWCFDLLGFLREGDPITQGESNLELHHENYTQENSEEDDEIVFEGTMDELPPITSFLLSPSNSNSTCASTASGETNVASNTTSFKNTGSNNKRKESYSVAALISTAAETLKEHSKRRKLLDDSPALTEDEFDLFELFGKSIAMELRKIQDKQVLNTLKKKIYILVIDAQ